MLDIIAILCLIGAIGLLLTLAVIDFKTFLLPNIFVAPFALLGPIFHWSTDFYYLEVTHIVIGGVAGYGLLYLIRMAGNKYYGQDSLGLGDVKLLGASGLWLGIEGVLFAMTIGAFVSLIHGLIYATHLKIKTKEPFNLTRLAIPAGPGFIIGIIIIGGWLLKSFIIELLHDLPF